MVSGQLASIGWQYPFLLYAVTLVIPIGAYFFIFEPTEKAPSIANTQSNSFQFSQKGLVKVFLTTFLASVLYYVYTLYMYLMTLFTEIKPFANQDNLNTSNSALLITEQYKKYLTEYIYDKQKVSDYAELLAISPNHLNKCVKNTVGKSAHDVLNEMLLLEAKFLLKQSNLNISEIACKIGRNEISGFGRFFKAQTAMSPSEYRMIGLNV